MGKSATTVDRAFLFTDIVGSTRLWERWPASMPAALASHRVALTAAIDGHGGRVFKSVGDGLFAAFDSVAATAAAAIEGQRALLRTPWSDVGFPEPLTVRMAIYAGSVEAVGSDFSGPVLNRLSRLLDAGHGGQILVAGDAATALAGTLPDGVLLRDLGERRLRDVPGVERILQLEAEGLPAAFPPIRTLDPIAHNLPIAPTPCFGREGELAILRTLLSHSESRFVTLIGPGGIGKTRLALQTAADLLDQFPDGVWFVDLTAVRENWQVASTAMRTLGLREDATTPAAEALVAWLRYHSSLLVLDNCEQVLAGAADLAATLLRGCAGVRLVATSRAPLRIRGERQMPVEPLPYPDALAEVAEVERNPAALLFTERVRDSDQSFTVRASNSAGVTGICRLLDGIPLALELAAAQPGSNDPQALLERLQHRLDVLQDGPRDLPERQRTLRDTIGWSYDLLDAPEQVAFARAGIFIGGWDERAAAALDRPIDASMLRASLQSLVRMSLARAEPEAGDDRRYAMLETIREFAVERLQASDTHETIAARHAGWFLALSEEIGLALEIGGKQREGLERLDRELGNLRAALAWLLAREAHEDALRMASALQYYWSSRGLVAEGRDALDRALIHAGEVEPAVAMRAWKRRGNLSIDLGDLHAAEEAFTRSLALARSLENTEGIARGLSSLGLVSNLQGKHDDEARYHEEGLRLFQALGDRHSIAVILLNQAHWARDTGQLDLACELMEQSNALRRELDDTLALIYGKAYLGRFERERGNLLAAERLLGEGIEEMHDFGDTNGLPIALNGLGATYVALGRLDEAEETLLTSLERTRAEGDRPNAAEALEWMTDIALRRGNRTEAAALLAEAASLRQQGRWPVPTGDRERVARLTAAVG